MLQARLSRFARHTLSAGLLLATLATTPVLADADDPEYMRVRGVSAGSTLNVRAGPGLDHAKIGELPADADGIRNLGCVGGLDFEAWNAASEEEREAARKDRWCQIEYGELAGWVAGRYLAQGTAAAAPAEGPADLVRIRWQLASSPAGPAAGEAWIEFDGAGGVSGKAGCNGFHGAAEFEAQSIGLSPLASTRMMCPAPLDAQETAVFKVLAEPLEYVVRDGNLTLRSSAGELRYARPAE